MKVTVTHENGTEGKWKVAVPIRVHLSDKTPLRIPKGFLTDFATVPRIFWPFIPPVGRYAGAALLHDYLYYRKYRNRRFCDKQLLFFLLKEDDSKIRSYIMWLAVRLFGWLYYYNRCNKKSF